jgi:hypothetical protein
MNNMLLPELQDYLVQRAWFVKSISKTMIAGQEKT